MQLLTGGKGDIGDFEVGEMLLLGIAVFGLALASLLFTREGGGVAAAWPANAVVLATILRRPTRHWPRALLAGWIGNVLAVFPSSHAVLPPLALSLSNTLEILVGAGALRRIVGPRLNLERPSHLFAFLAAAGVIAPAISAASSAAALAWLAHRPHPPSASTWYAAHALGLIVITPALLALDAPRLRALAEAVRKGRGGGALATLALALACVFGQTQYLVFFLVPPALIYVAFELGVGGAAIALLCTAVLAVVLTLTGHGPAVLARGALAARLGVLQLFLATLTVSVLPVAAALAKRAKFEASALRAASYARASRRRAVEAKAAMEASEARYRLLADNANDVIVQVGADGVIQFVAPSCERLFGHRPETMIGAPMAAFIHPDDAPTLIEHILALVDAGPAADRITVQFRMRHVEGRWLWVEGRPRIGFGPGGEYLFVHDVIRDISDRKVVEAGLAESEFRYRLIAENATDVVMRHRPDGRTLYVSPAVRTVLGYEPVDVEGRALSDFIHPDDSEPKVARWRAMLMAQSPQGEPDRFRLRHKHGRWVWLESNPTAVRDATGRVTEVVDIMRDVSARVGLEEALQRAKETAEEASRAKSSFLASMSHEIRTPMNGVIGFADLLLDSDLTEPQRLTAGRLRDCGEALLAVINDILDISKIEAGKLDIERIPFDPRALIEGAAVLLAAQFGAKGLTLDIEIAPDTPAGMWGDPTRMRQILLNYLSNALKFTREGGVKVRAWRDEEAGRGRLRVEVTDTGMGISPDRQHMLFQNFSQVNSSTTRQFGGTGLGLAICRRLAAALGGETGVVSAEGKGSTFWFTVDCEPCAPPETARSAPQGLSPGRGAKILVADDVELNQIVVQSMLQAAGYEVTLVADGAQAVEAAQARDFDLILMDMQMPRVDGLAATRRIRGLGDRLREIPIVALTANAMLEDVERCRAAGMNDHLAKPIRRGQLLAVVGKWTGAPLAVAACDPRGQDGPSLDEGALSALEGLMGPGKVAKLSTLFETRLRGVIAAFAVGSAGPDEAREAHNVIGLAGMFGCTDLMETARDLDKAMRVDERGVPGLAEAFTKAAEQALLAVRERYPLGIAI